MRLGQLSPLCIGPVALISSVCEDGTVDFTAITEVCEVSKDPAMIVLALNKAHAACRNIATQRKFGFNVPCAAIIDKADYVANFPVQGSIKQTIFETFRSDQEVPLIKECQVSSVCIVDRIIDDLPGPNTLIIANIVNTICDKSYIGPTGAPDIMTINPLIAALQDSRYFAVGPYLGTKMRACQQIIERQNADRKTLDLCSVELQK